MPEKGACAAVSDDIQAIGADAATVRRDRAFTITDATIRSDGDGRTVEAYCAAFNVPAEIHDQDGHYNEVISPGSFDRTISHNGTRFGVFYNHARTIYGTPDGALSVPIGVPVEAPRADSHGVMTVTRYLDANPLADAILGAIKQKAINGQSFSGRFMKSAKTRASDRGGLPTIARTEVAMREYGPTPFPAYVEAAITGTRSAESWLHELIGMDREERADLFTQMLALATPLDPSTTSEPLREVVVVMPPRTDSVEPPSARTEETTDPERPAAAGQTPESGPSDTAPEAPVDDASATSTEEPGHADEDPPARHSLRQADIARRTRVTRILLGGAK